MKTKNQAVRFVLGCLLLVLGVTWGSLVWGVPPGRDGPPGQGGGKGQGGSPGQAAVTYSGRAFAAFLNVPTLGIGPQFISDTEELPPGGGFQSAELATVEVPGVLSASLLVASTSGANGVARSRASLADVMVLPGNAAQVTASFVQAESEATCNGVRGSTEVADVTFGGQAIMVDPFAQNQTFTIPDPLGGAPLATLVINEQKTSSGNGTQDLTVNALHLTLVTGDEVILASAHSDVMGCPGCPPKPRCFEFVTGGGWIPVGSSKANFGFNAGFKPNLSTPEIHFNYIDHNSGMQMKATSISVYAKGDTATTRHMEGNAEIDGVAGFTYSIDVADNGEPGRNTDSLKISLSNGYSAGGTLAGGNIQLHRPCP
jgi:hypothetical protein